MRAARTLAHLIARQSRPRGPGLRVIDGDTVRALYPIADAVPDMSGALVDFSRGEAYQHPRVIVEPPGNGGRVLLMHATSADTLGLKVLSIFPRSAERGLPGVQGLVILIDAVHGEPLAIIDGAAVTEIRTAAVTVLATERLMPPSAGVLSLIGAGVQARGHLIGLSAIRSWTAIRVCSRTAERAEALAAWAAEAGIRVEVAASAADALRGAEVICTVTSAGDPVLADADVGRAGVHVNAVGAFGADWRELPSELVARSRVVVDSREAALREAGDLMIPMSEGVLGAGAIAAELGEVLAGDRPGRLGDEVTVFKSLGLPIEDVVACDTIYRRAVERGAGHEIRSRRPVSRTRWRRFRGRWWVGGWGGVR